MVDGCKQASKGVSHEANKQESRKASEENMQAQKTNKKGRQSNKQVIKLANKHANWLTSAEAGPMHASQPASQQASV